MSNSTLPRRVLGRRLREFREERKMSRTHAARACEMGSQTLWRLETGRSSEIKRVTVNLLCDLYGVVDEDRRILLWLATESRKDGWWQSFAGGFTAWVELYIGLEAEACSYSTWQSAILPGLLQIPEYRRALWELQGQPVDIESELGLLAKRQERVADPSFTLKALVNESALRQNVGGKDVMVQQMRHLLEIARLPNVSVRTVPFSAPVHLGLHSKDFVFLEFPEHPNPALTESPVIYIENSAGALYLDKPAEIEIYRATRADIERVALSENDTRSLIEARQKEYGS
ncbi:helix-turn-helix domain-containing protein [Nocardia jiangxiensis]|uniref:helix-turn-helix domain-containing protein n=1 Tax=Nocardia jiangxiensis TaxID=282685 RepID=UPI00146E01D6|nr:helix-turn-helix transcriptional regulator [Nocardia jiangxiensis]